MLLGLFKASASLQGYMNKILVKKLYIFIIIYLNNLFIYIENADQGHVKAVY